MSNIANEQVEKWSAFCEMLTDIQNLLTEIGNKLFINGYLKPENLQEFSYGMTYYWLCSWPIGYHLHNLLDEAKTIADEMSQNESLVHIAEGINSEIIEPLEQDETVPFWQMIMDSTDEQNARRFEDGFYGEKGAFLEKVESVIKFNILISREALTFWSRLADSSVTQSGNPELRQQIYDVLSSEIEKCDPMAPLTPEACPSDLGLDALEVLEVLEGVKESLNGNWHLDFEGAFKLNGIPLDQIVTWVEQRLTGK